MIWFTSDLHFGHAGIRVHQDARFHATCDLADMDAMLVDAINDWVRPSDTLYHLGDFCWKASRAGHYRARLNVRELHFIKGNHDANSLRRYGSSLRELHYARFKMWHDTWRIRMSHEPMLSWRGMQNGSVHLYGHSHGNFEEKLDAIWPNRRAMDVGIDNIHRLSGVWRPISINEVYARLMTRPLEGRHEHE
ncbi:MAG: metallophosphoesterase family protein [Planctomycetota bacterium]|jgi:calcineurin-like phosphoesterase family protein